MTLLDGLFVSEIGKLHHLLFKSYSNCFCAHRERDGQGSSIDAGA